MSVRQIAVAILGIVACTALILVTMGRPLVYRNGPLRLWSGDINSDQNSQQLADPYSFTHLEHGVGLYALLAVVGRRLPVAPRLVAAVALECTWEVLENTDYSIRRYRERTLARGYYGDSVVNSMGDVLAAIVGFALAARLPRRATVAAVIALELLLLLWIRDGLLLNILMLIHPFAAVKDWQTAIQG